MASFRKTKDFKFDKVQFTTWASQVAQLVKNPPAMWETWVWSLGCEDPLEKGKATHSRILAWGSPRTVQPTGSQMVGHHWAIFTFNVTNYFSSTVCDFHVLDIQGIFLNPKGRKIFSCFLLGALEFWLLTFIFKFLLHFLVIFVNGKDQVSLFPK